MRILEYTAEMGNDFMAILVCEHCGNRQKLQYGYHDRHYHTRVIPAITCQACHKNRSGIVPDVLNPNGTVPVLP
jgi:hypothetical protein